MSAKPDRLPSIAGMLFSRPPDGLVGIKGASLRLPTDSNGADEQTTRKEHHSTCAWIFNQSFDVLVAFLIFFVTLEGVKLYAPILIRSGFGSPIIPGPLLEKSAISFDDVVVFPNLG